MGVIALVALVLNLVGGYWIPAAMCVLLLAAVVTFLWGPTLVGDPGPGRTRARRNAAVGAAVVLLLTVASVVAHLGAGNGLTPSALPRMATPRPAPVQDPPRRDHGSRSPAGSSDLLEAGRPERFVPLNAGGRTDR